MMEWWIIAIPTAALIGVSVAFIVYVKKQNKMIDGANDAIEAYLDGAKDSVIPCCEEGRIGRLLHNINILATTLNAHTDDEIRSKQFLRDVMQDVSHQLKTPISALSIYNEVLQGEDLDEETIKHFNSLSEQEITRMENLVSNLLTITKLDAMSIKMNMEPVGVGELAGSTAERFAYRAKSEGKTLILEESSEMEVMCDRVWMGEAFDNLVKNALDHTKTGDKIIIGWRRSGSEVEITFTDNGSGIHEEDIYYIFNRFYRSRFAQDTAGIGLGLSLVKTVVEHCDGTIDVESELDKGTVFRVYLKCSHE